MFYIFLLTADILCACCRTGGVGAIVCTVRCTAAVSSPHSPAPLPSCFQIVAKVDVYQQPVCPVNAWASLEVVFVSGWFSLDLPFVSDVNHFHCSATSFLQVSLPAALR